MRQKLLKYVDHIEAGNMMHMSYGPITFTLHEITSICFEKSKTRAKGMSFADTESPRPIGAELQIVFRQERHKARRKENGLRAGA
jgi:hypothetical protein